MDNWGAGGRATAGTSPIFPLLFPFIGVSALQRGCVKVEGGAPAQRLQFRHISLSYLRLIVLSSEEN